MYVCRGRSQLFEVSLRRDFVRRIDGADGYQQASPDPRTSPPLYTPIPHRPSPSQPSPDQGQGVPTRPYRHADAPQQPSPAPSAAAYQLSPAAASPQVVPPPSAAPYQLSPAAASPQVVPPQAAVPYPSNPVYVVTRQTPTPSELHSPVVISPETEKPSASAMVAAAAAPPSSTDTHPSQHSIQATLKGAPAEEQVNVSQRLHQVITEQARPRPLTPIPAVPLRPIRTMPFPFGCRSALPH